MPTMTTRDPAPGTTRGDGGVAVDPTHDGVAGDGDGGLVVLLEDLLAASGLYVALAAAWTSTLGSLCFSEVRGFTPCTLCWYQRILMYPLAVILLVAIGRRDRGAHLYVLPLSVLGIWFSTYHYLIQKTSLFSHATACSAGVPCSGMYINWRGFVTIPLLALGGFLIVTLATSASRRAAGSADAGVPWGPVAITLGAVVAFFAAVLALD